MTTGVLGTTGGPALRHPLLMPALMSGVVALCALLGLVVLSGDVAGVGLSLTLVVGLALAGVILLRPVAGVYVILFGVLLVEQFAFSDAFSPATMAIPLYKYVLGEGIPVAPLDFLFGLTALGSVLEWLRAPRGAKRERLPRKGFGLGLAVLMGALVVAECVGLARAECAGYSPVGGTLVGCNFRVQVSVFELRAFVYAAVCSFLAFRHITSVRRARVMLVVVAGAMAIKVFQTFDRLFTGVTRNYTEDKMRALTAHEDAMFFGIVLAMVMGVVAYRGRGTLERSLLVLGPGAVAALAIANRRAAYVGLGLFLIAYFISLPRQPALRLVRMLAPGVLLFAIYVPLFWNTAGTIGRPARAVHAIVAPSGIDLRSNAYREIEAYDLQHGLADHLWLGQGLGHLYPQPIPLPELESEYQPFIAHQELLWFWLAAGSGGFVALWLWFGGMYVTVASVLRRTTDPTVATLATMALAAIVMEIVAAAVDLQLTFYRNMTVVGLLVGAAARCGHLVDPPEPTAPRRPRHLRERTGAPSWATSSSG